MQILFLSGAKHLYEYFQKILKKGEFFLIEQRFFPDNEQYIRIPFKPKDSVTIVQSMYGKPDERLVETLFVSKTLKEMGVLNIIALIPYLAYTRQDKRYKEGEVISQTITLELLGNFINELITIDAHFHEGIPEIKNLRIKNIRLSPFFKIFFENIKANPNYVVIGPDDDSYILANLLAKELELDSGFIEKKRIGDSEVKVFNCSIDVKTKNVILIDDIISTGSTVIEAIKFLRREGVDKIHVAATHGLFVADSLEKLEVLRLESIITSNSVPNRYALLDVSPVLIGELKDG